MAPLDPISAIEHFKRSRPQCERVMVYTINIIMILLFSAQSHGVLLKTESPVTTLPLHLLKKIGFLALSYTSFQLDMLPDITLRNGLKLVNFQ